MLSKAIIVKYSTLLIAFTAGVFFTLSAQGISKAIKAYNSADTVSVEVKAEATAPVETKPENNTSVAANRVLSKAELQTIATKFELNNYVLKIIPEYEGEEYPYLLNNDYENYNGVTENIVYQDAVIAKADSYGSKASHCVGLTYEVFFKAMQARNRDAGITSDNFNNMTVEDMKDFLLTWYAAKGYSKSEGNQIAGAIVKYGLGIQITNLEDAKAGDFIDFSRTKSGHTAVFINWLRDDKDNIVGFRYWSTQESTNGIGYKEEYFSDNSQEAFQGMVDRNQLYIGRVEAIANYRPF